MSDIYMKVGDLLPVLTGTLTDDQGNPQAIPGGSTVTFVMKKNGSSSPLVSRAATIVDASTGKVSYSWVAGDTVTAGYYLIEWLLIAPGALPQRFPNNRSLTLNIGPNQS